MRIENENKTEKNAVIKGRGAMRSGKINEKILKDEIKEGMELAEMTERISWNIDVSKNQNEMKIEKAGESILEDEIENKNMIDDVIKKRKDYVGYVLKNKVKRIEKPRKNIEDIKNQDERGELILMEIEKLVKIGEMRMIRENKNIEVEKGNEGMKEKLSKCKGGEKW